MEKVSEKSFLCIQEPIKKQINRFKGGLTLKITLSQSRFNCHVGLIVPIFYQLIYFTMGFVCEEHLFLILFELKNHFNIQIFHFGLENLKI